MQIGIIVHSCTGNTLSVADRLLEKLTSSGHRVTIERVSAQNDDEQVVQNIRLNKKPDISAYDVLIFGAPVRGFSLSPVMQAFLSGAALRGKRTACFITQGFSSPWMGGNRALGQMVELLRSKGTEPYGTGIVNWPNAAKREKQIGEVADKLCKLA